MGWDGIMVTWGWHMGPYLRPKPSGMKQALTQIWTMNYRVWWVTGNSLLDFCADPDYCQVWEFFW